MSMVSFPKTKLGLVLLSTTISFVLLVGIFEIVQNIRYCFWKASLDHGTLGKITVPSPNPVLMWEYRPSSRCDQIVINRYGFRDRDYESMEKPKNTFRIAFVGDSVTMGFRVDLEDTFVRQFEAEANRMDPGRRIQVLNCAVAGYSTPQICEMVRTKVLRFSPDKVVYVLCLNDFDFVSSAGIKIRYFRRPRSFFLSMVERVRHRLMARGYYRYHFSKNKEEVFQNILDMRKMVERKGGSFQVVTLPIFPQQAQNFERYPIRDLHRAIGDFLTESGIASLDLLEAFEKNGSPPRYYSRDPWHLNVEGHRFVARQLLPAILPD